MYFAWTLVTFRFNSYLSLLPNFHGGRSHSSLNLRASASPVIYTWHISLIHPLFRNIVDCLVKPYLNQSNIHPFNTGRSSSHCRSFHNVVTHLRNKNSNIQGSHLMW